MPGNYAHTTRADGSLLTAAIYNQDHQNHITFATPGGLDDYSTNVSQMQSTVDPGEVGTESLPTDLAGEIQRLRQLIKEITGKTQWYESPNVSLKDDSTFRIVGSSDATKKLAFEVDGITTATTRTVIAQNKDGTMALLGDNQPSPVLNGAFNIWQRGTSFVSVTTPANNDDTHLMDRWYLLSDGNDVVDVTREGTTIPAGGLYAVALDVETVNKKFGIAQIIEQKNCIGFIGQTCTLSFKAKVSSTTKLDNLKAAIIAWSGAADAVTSDIISVWEAEGVNPTLIANATYENAPANLVPTTSYATYSVTAPIDTASAKNIILFIWSDVTDTTLGDFLYITDVKLELGNAASAFQFRTFNEELDLCKRYYQKSFPYETAPVQNAGLVGSLNFPALQAGAVQRIVQFPYDVVMRTTPTLTFYNPSAANAEARNTIDAADASATSTHGTFASDAAGTVSLTTNAGAAIGETFAVHWTADAEL